MNMRKENIDYVERVKGVFDTLKIGSEIKDRKDYNTDGTLGHHR